MTVAQDWTARNAGFVTDRFRTGLRMMPALRTIVIGCVDPRVDPNDVLGLGPGEAAVIRNVGGRVTSDVLAELTLLRAVTQAAGADLAAGWELVVLQHTDCGITRLGDEPARLAAYLGTDDLAARAVDDPLAAVALDIAALRAHVDPEVVVTGLVYDVATGLVSTVAAN